MKDMEWLKTANKGYELYQNGRITKAEYDKIMEQAFDELLTAHEDLLKRMAEHDH